MTSYSGCSAAMCFRFESRKIVDWKQYRSVVFHDPPRRGQRSRNWWSQFHHRRCFHCNAPGDCCSSSNGSWPVAESHLIDKQAVHADQRSCSAVVLWFSPPLVSLQTEGSDWSRNWQTLAYLRLRSMSMVLVTGTVKLVLVASHVSGIMRCSRSKRENVITFRIMFLLGLNEWLLRRESPFHHFTDGNGFPTNTPMLKVRATKWESAINLTSFRITGNVKRGILVKRASNVVDVIVVAIVDWDSFCWHLERGRMSEKGLFSTCANKSDMRQSADHVVALISVPTFSSVLTDNIQLHHPVNSATTTKVHPTSILGSVTLYRRIETKIWHWICDVKCYSIREYRSVEKVFASGKMGH